MPSVVTRIMTASARRLGCLPRSVEERSGIERLRRRLWLINLLLFTGLALATLSQGAAGWPLRLAATAGLVGACVWEGAAVRAGRFPLWADLLETATAIAVFWRYPTDGPLLVALLTFLLPALTFRVLYSSPWQAGLRATTALAAGYIGSILPTIAAGPGPDQATPAHPHPPAAVAFALVVIMCAVDVAHLLRVRSLAARRRNGALRFSADLAAARSRADVHAALLRAVHDLLSDRFGERAQVRVVVWDEPDTLQPTVAAGTRAGEVRTANGRSLSAVPWIRDALAAGDRAYRESFDRDQLRPSLGCEPIPGSVLIVPLRHHQAVRALSVEATGPIPPPMRADIQYLTGIGEMALGSIELTRLGKEGLGERSDYDPATRLGNRELLRLRLEETLADPGRRVALLRLHLDHFKTIGDSLGNLAGGQALVILAGRLAGCVRAGDTIARISGDDFAILLDQPDDPDTAARVAEWLLRALDEPLPGVLGATNGVVVRGCVGVALSSPTVRTPGDLLRNAELALEAAYRAGSGSYRVFEPAMHASILDQLQLASDLSKASDRGELAVHYQPLVRLPTPERASERTAGIVGVEALVRWDHPHRGQIPPSRFIPIAEDTGAITAIGAWVLREGCQQLRAWTEAHPGLGSLVLGVNVSPAQLAQPDLISTIRRTVEETGVDPARLVAELTESALVEDSAANLGRLQALKDLGPRLAVDDFGTGFSSLSYLRRFPFDHIKLDRSFVHEVDVDEARAALASSIIRMAQALDLTAVAEGVETAGQAHWLAKAGCDVAQGHLFAPAMPPDQLFPLLTSGLPFGPRST